jgi:hypothetical protein
MRLITTLNHILIMEEGITGMQAIMTGTEVMMMSVISGLIRTGEEEVSMMMTRKNSIIKQEER